VVTSALAGRLRPAVEARLDDEEFGVDELAAAMFMERTGLYRHMVDEMRTTPSEFIRDVRLQRAAELLGEDANTVSEVAYAVGYRSVSSFSRLFRDRFGCSPAAFAHRAVAAQPG
jgi:AraC-like DNA-binding protein